MSCCLPRRPRYMVLVKALYPPEINSPIPPNSLEHFLFYAVQNQQQLQDSTEYLCNKLRRKMVRRQNRKAEIIVETTVALINRIEPASITSVVDTLMRMIQVSAIDSYVHLLNFSCGPQFITNSLNILDIIQLNNKCLRVK